MAAAVTTATIAARGVPTPMIATGARVRCRNISRHGSEQDYRRRECTCDWSLHLVTSPQQRATRVRDWTEGASKCSAKPSRASCSPTSR